VDDSSATDPRLTRSIPREGIEEVSRGWSGEGSVYEALASVASSDAVQWSASDIRRRARRVLLGLLDPLIAAWPSSSLAWEEHLPSTSRAEKRVSRIPSGSVNWRETHRTSGWPPREYSLRTRRRATDEVALGTLVWVSNRIRNVAADARPLAPATAVRVEGKLDAVDGALAGHSSRELPRPGRLDLLSLRTSGHPWTSVGAAAEMLAKTEQDPEFVAFEMLAPDPDTQWRLFHLAAFGMVIRSLRSHRFQVTWRRPLSGTRPGPQVEAVDPSGSSYDLWFEAGAARSAYGLPKGAYTEAVRAIQGVGSPIGVDVMLLDKGSRALLFECKWSTDSQYVGRDGFHQSASYALDALDGLAAEVWSFVVGPHDVVPETSVADGSHKNLGVVLGSTSPMLVEDVVSAFLAGRPTDLL
jgi:hypothetical protein